MFAELANISDGPTFLANLMIVLIKNANIRYSCLKVLDFYFNKREKNKIDSNLNQSANTLNKS